MSFDTERKRLGRRPVTIIELDLDFCNHTYGTAPCTAAIGVTGADRCYNTRKTCQDAANYDPAAKTYRFSTQNLGTKGVVFPYFHTLQGIQTAPTKIEPMKGLGQRASVVATFQDEPTHDLGTDKYARLRAYDAAKQGTFWGKLLARNPYYQGRIMRVRLGYLEADGTFDWANFRTQLYAIDSIDGPDSRGVVKVTAKDLLKLADDKRAQAPALSTGQLTTSITNVATTFSVGSGQGADYPASGTICLEKELMTYTRSGDAFTVIRATDGTAAVTHDAATLVQLCIRYTTAKVADVAYDLLTTYGNVPTGYITKPDWDTEGDDWMLGYLVSTVISKPTGVTTLLTDLCLQGLCYLWWDEFLQKIQFRNIHPPRTSTITTLTDANNLLEDSFAVKESPTDRISQVWVYYGKRAPNLDDKEESYKQVYQLIDVDASSSQEYGEVRIRKVFAYWLPVNSDAAVSLLAFRMLASLRDNPRLFTFDLDSKDSDVWTGSIIQLTSTLLQGPDGAPLTTNLQVVQVQEKTEGSINAYQALQSAFTARYGFITYDDLENYDVATENEKLLWGYVAPDSGVFADGGAAYKII